MESIFDLTANELEGVEFSSDSMEMDMHDLFATNLILQVALTNPNKDISSYKRYIN
jgi:hypothetical protein